MFKILEDLKGQRFHRLLVRERAPDYVYTRRTGALAGKQAKRTRWFCVCDCGKETIVFSNALKKDKRGTKSCGCLHRDLNRDLFLALWKTCKASKRYQEEFFLKQGI